jgi:hypothetical protein
MGIAMQQIVKIQVKLSKRKIALIYAAILVEKAAHAVERSAHVVAKNIIKRSVEVVPVESKESTPTS